MQRGEILFVHGSHALKTEVLFGPLAALVPIDRMDVFRRPFELLNRATAVARNPVNIVLRERAPVGSNDRRSAQEGLYGHAPTGLVVVCRS